MRASAHQGRSLRWGRLASLLIALALLLTLAPALAHAQSDTLVLVWTAPGDDGSIGTASSYEIRMSTSPINDANFGSASLIPGAPTPVSAGVRQRVTVRGLTHGTTYYFALKTADDVGNVSGISNVVRWDWVYDTAPPAAPAGLTASKQGNSVHLHWNANSEADLAGYTVYRASTQNGTYSVISGSLLATNDYIDAAPPATGTAWYRVSASDASGNESARSAAASVDMSTVAAAVTEWHLDPAYPNPSRGSDPVTVPVIVPSGGAGAAEAQIADAGRRIVRRISLAGLSAGSQSLVWDGRNDAGRLVAPGVYTVWVIDGDRRTNVRVVRVP
jgi:hypothetical protein